MLLDINAVLPNALYDHVLGSNVSLSVADIYASARMPKCSPSDPAGSRLWTE